MSKIRPPSTLTNSIGLEDDLTFKGLKLEVFASKIFDDMADWRMMSSSGTEESSVEMAFRIFLNLPSLALRNISGLGRKRPRTVRPPGSNLATCLACSDSQSTSSSLCSRGTSSSLSSQGVPATKRTLCVSPTSVPTKRPLPALKVEHLRTDEGCPVTCAATCKVFKLAAETRLQNKAPSHLGHLARSL